MPTPEQAAAVFDEVYPDSRRSGADAQRHQFRQHYVAQVSKGVCPYSGETIKHCQGSDLCDCFDFPTGEVLG